ncbi:MAG: dimethylglycine dehydrogenase, partial [Woeseiaceae bacterium]|nr:dimethylglycine dehydrogenase [Woeseiaceae bacterium]
GVDPRRFGDYVSKEYLIEKTEEAYAYVFETHFPDEERPAGRPLKVAPCYEKLKSMGAVFGQKFGWERANWFATDGMKQEDDWSFRRSKWFTAIEKEVQNVTTNAGLLDMTAFAKCRLSGPGVEEFLNFFVANRIPRKIGQISLCHALNSHGGIHSEFTILKESADSFYLVSAGALQRLDHDYIRRFLPSDGTVKYSHLTDDIGVLVLAGPKSRDILTKLSSADFSNKSFRWLTAKDIEIEGCSVNAMRVNYVGELGWELHHPIKHQNQIFDALFEVGEEFGLKPFGIRAMDSMRIEKSYRMVGTELSIEYSAFESGMDRFICLDKDNFIGREELIEWQERGSENQLVTLEIDGVEEADALGNNALTSAGELIGRATGGGFGFRVNRSLALAMVKPQYANEGTEFSIDILGKDHIARVIQDSPFDSQNRRLRDVIDN